MSTFTLRVYDLSIEIVRLLAELIVEIARHDPDLARQLRRALSSIPLNIAEAIDGVGGNRQARFRTALGSTNECIAIVEVGEALGYVVVDDATKDKLQRVRATLLKLVMRKRA